MRCTSTLACALALVLAPPLLAAKDKPTQKEISAARSECSKQRRRVEKMESDPKADPAVLARASSEWESACARAEALMQAAGLEEPSPPPRDPVPPQPIVIVEPPPPGPPPDVVIDEDPVPPTVPEAPPRPH